jgi:hypothetical protein
MADKIFLAEKRFNSNDLIIPVFYYLEKDEENSFDTREFNPNRYFNNVNLIVNETDTYYAGPANYMSEMLLYKKIVGIDPVDLFLATDSYNDFTFEISDNGFLKTQAHVGSLDEIEKEKIKNDLNNRVFDGNGVFNLGNLLYSKYPLVEGSSVNFHGINEEVKDFACLFFVSKKRELIASKFVFVKTKEKDEFSLDEKIYDKMIEIDPENKDYELFISRKSFNKETKVFCGFLETASHLKIHYFDARIKLFGIGLD